MEDQKEYWSQVGILLYLAKHSRPDIANAARKMSKANNDAISASSKELLHMIRYVLDQKNFGQKLEPTRNANGSNYSGDPVSKKSVSGFILCVLVVMLS